MEHLRPQGWRFIFGGVNLKDSADSLSPTKYACAQNVRGYSALSIRCRPGYGSLFTTGGNPITDMRAYAALGTDDKPRWVARDNANGLYLDTGALLTTLGGAVGPGVSLIPFRPSASPQTWLYAAALGDYEKLSAPDASNNVTVQKVGIPEPQVQVEFAPQTLDYTDFTHAAAQWTAGGSATTPSDGTRSTDTIVAVFSDPANTTRKTCQVGVSVQYQIGEITNQGVIQDVLPPISAGLVVHAIRYASGSTGLCTIVPSQLPIGTEIPGAISAGFLRRGALVKIGATEVCLVLDVADGPGGLVSFDTSTSGTYSNGAAIAGIPAIIIDSATAAAVSATKILTTVAPGVGTLVQTLGSSPFGTQLGSSGIFPQEDDYVHFSVLITNPAQILELKILFNVDSTDPTFTQNVYYYSISPNALAGVATGQQTQTAALTAQQQLQIGANQTNAVTLEQQIQSLQFAIQMAGGASSNPNMQTELTMLQQELLLVQNKQPVIPTVITTAAQTAAGSSQWTEILFPVSSLTRIGNDQTRTLVNCNGVQVYINVESVTGTWTPSTFFALGYQVVDAAGHIQQVAAAGISGSITPTWNDSGGTTSDGSITWTDEGLNAVTLGAQISSFWIGGGGQPDVGDGGADYRYRAVPRSSLTGVMGNSSPAPRHGTRPRRQNVVVKTSALSVPDAQVDTWDVYRYGGAVTSWNYIGSVPAGSDFTDSYFDDTALAGNLLDANNFEPWPTVDLPFIQTGNVAVFGTWVVLSSMTTPLPANLPKWLPGTLITLAGLQTFTLRSRPIQLSSTSYLFELIECAGYGTPASFTVQEPDVADQALQSVWGPDAQGVFFGVQDPLRPGTISWSKGNEPDSVPSMNNRDLCPPSEPLLGGCVRNGVSLVGSTHRWWALYPDFATAGLYNPIEAPVGRALISPWGHITDGARIFFWCRDGIAETDGGPYKSLTDEDLYPLFPHDGVDQGQNVVRNGVTFYAPDYSRAGAFRLGLSSGYLYASYKDTTNTYRMLVCDLRTGAWCSDAYADQITGAWALEGQPGTLGTGAPAVYPAMLLAGITGNVYQSADLIADNGTAIPVVLATMEWDGGDQRAPFDFGDGYLDSFPVVTVTVTPVALGAGIATATVIPYGTARNFSPISLGGVSNHKYVGLQITWTETFYGGKKTLLHLWQLSVIPRPEVIGDRYGDWQNSMRG